MIDYLESVRAMKALSYGQAAAIHVTISFPLASILP
jgi:hypothetical protein